MPSILNPYINFKAKCREAMTFYQTVFGGKLELNTFKENHASTDPSEDELIMHSMLTTDNGMTLMASDTPNRLELKPGNEMSISLSGDNEAELRGYWDKLAVDATITMPIEKAPWGDTFGMLTDKFGVQWLVNIAGSKA